MKKQSKKEILESYGVYGRTGFSWLRYKTPPEKGIYWYLFSLYIRQRDVEKYGTCISCGKPITVDTCDAGHFIPAGSCGRDLLFDERNVNAECGRCNAWDEGHLFGYEKNLDLRYGEGTAQALKERYFEYKNSPTPIKDWKVDIYREKIHALKSYPQVAEHDDA